MAILTRVPLVDFTLNPKPTPSPPLALHQCHKCGRLAQHNPIASLSFQPIVSSISPVSQKGFTRRRVGALSLVAMADSGRSTVLVTGAGGRTGNSAVFSLLCWRLFNFNLAAEGRFWEIRRKELWGLEFLFWVLEFCLRVYVIWGSVSSPFEGLGFL